MFAGAVLLWLSLAQAPAARAAAPIVDPELLRHPAPELFSNWTPPSELFDLAAADEYASAVGPAGVSDAWTLTDKELRDRAKAPARNSEPETRIHGKVFFKGWLTITAFEATLLAATATAPKEWTGWSPQFIKDGLGNFRDAYSAPPEWDSDSWPINYVGHPYGGSIYYNTVRCQGASKTSSFLFSLLMSTQWEYSFEALAEHPSTQDLIVTPIAGAILGEFTHNLTQRLTSDGSGLVERVLLTVLNPMHTFYIGF